MTEPFAGRDELVALLHETLPAGWIDAASAGDHANLAAIKDSADHLSIIRALGRAGWVLPGFPTDEGGRAMSSDDERAAFALLDGWSVPRIPRGSGMLAAPTLAAWSSDKTRRRFLPPLATGDELWCQLFSEPGAGSDMASLATSARRDGDEWVVNGQKVWTTLGHEADVAMLIARTDPDQPKHPGITYFALDMHAPGVEVRTIVNIAGQDEFNEVFLTDVRIADLNRMSPIGKGWSAAMTTLGAERHALSGMEKKRKASDEILGGRPLDDVMSAAVARGAADDANVRLRLTDEHTADRLLWWTTQRAKARAAGGQPPGAEGSITKNAKAASNQSLQELGLAIRGADSLAWEAGDEDAADWIAQFLRTRANSLEGGTSEIQRNIVGERVLGLPREPDPFTGVAWREIPRS